MSWCQHLERIYSHQIPETISRHMKGYRKSIFDSGDIFLCRSSTYKEDIQLNKAIRQKLVRLIQDKANIFGIELLAWSVTNRGFFILVNKPELTALSDKEIISNNKKENSDARAKSLAVKQSRKKATSVQRGALGHKVTRKTFSLPAYIKSIKMDLVREWQAASPENKGKRFWGSRYKLAVVENTPSFLLDLMATVHAQPFKAGLCKSPKNCSTSSFGEACKSNVPMRKSLMNLMGVTSWEVAMKAHCIAIKQNENANISRYKYGSVEFRAKIRKKVAKAKVTVRQKLPQPHVYAKQRLKELKKFHQKYGHCLVPTIWIENPDLARWVRKQRQRQANGLMSRERYDELNALGFTWKYHADGSRASIALRPDQKNPGSTKHSIAWDENYQKLQAFHKMHGHCKVGRTDYPLSRWLYKQKSIYFSGKLNFERKAKLKKLKAFDF
jgi:hypothetical protein